LEGAKNSNLRAQVQTWIDFVLDPKHFSTRECFVNNQTKSRGWKREWLEKGSGTNSVPNPSGHLAIDSGPLFQALTKQEQWKRSNLT